MKQQIRLPATANRAGIIERVSRMLRGLACDKAWVIEVSEYKPRRTLAQNSLLWGWVYPQVLKVAHDRLPDATVEELHEFFLEQHYGFVRKDFFGMPKRVAARRSSNMDKQMFSDHIQFIVAYMANSGYFVELPEDYREAVAA